MRYNARQMPEPAPPRRLLLASRSPRRALLLQEAGYTFTRFDPPFADPADPNLAGDHPADGRGRAQSLARAKAMSVPPRMIEPGAVLLTADTIGIDPQGQLIGTPESPAEAMTMLRRLLGRSHQIATGLTLRDHDGQTADLTDVATVHLGEVVGSDLEKYVDAGGWRGKAGGYNLADRLDAGWPIRVDGDPSTVMGLPMVKLTPLLKRWGVTPSAALSSADEPAGAGRG